MAEVTNSCYQMIRDFLETTGLGYIKLINTVDDSVAFASATGVPGTCEWTHVPLAEVLELTITVLGSDVGIPKTANKLLVFKDLTDAGDLANAKSEELFTSFTWEDNADKLIIRHRIEVPQGA